MATITLFYITTGNQDTAVQLATLAIEKKLAGCANIHSIHSIYPWEFKLQDEEEFVLVLKTVPLLKDPLRQLISDHHPYKVPCIMSWDVEVNEQYGRWIAENMGL